MNRLFVCIALLLGSVPEPLLAQPDHTFDSELNADAFKKEYPSLLGAASFEVKLSKGNVLLLKSKKYSQLKLMQHPDSLVRLFWDDYRSVVEGIPEDTDGLSVHYFLNETEEPQLRLKKYPLSTNDFTVMDKELVRLKTMQDTLKIIVNRNDREAELFLLVNDLRDIPTLFDEMREKTVFLFESMEKRTDPKVLDRSPEVYGRYLGNRQVQMANFGSDMLIISPGASIGYIRGNWVTSLNAGFTFYLEKSNLKPTFGYHHQYFFGRDTDGKTKAFQNGFAMAGLAFFKKSDSNVIGRRPIVQTGSLTLGYLVHRRGDYYEPNTWRVTGGLNLTPNVKVEPEVYFNGAFKNLSPGLRFTIGF